MYYLPDCKDICEIILNICFVASFITIFYFVYGKILEKKIFTAQLTNAVNTILNNTRLIPNMQPENPLKPPISIHTEIIEYLKTQKPPDTSSEDAKINASNKKIEKEAFIIIGSIVATGILITIFIWWKGSYFFKSCSFSYIECLGKSIIIVILIGIIEFLFLTFYVSKYMYLDTNAIMYKSLLQLYNTIYTN